MKKHFVTFYSPGTFTAEETTKAIESWDVKKAMAMAGDIIERHGATPYGFRFVTRERGTKDFDSRETKRSPMFYLGGKILTLAAIKKRKRTEDKILISNMELNGWKRIVENDNSWRWAQPLRKGDRVLRYTPPKKEIG